jgi:hypothetical protein
MHPHMHTNIHLRIHKTHYQELEEPPSHIIDEGVPVIQLYLRRLASARTTCFLDLEGLMLAHVDLSFYNLKVKFVCVFAGFPST